MDYRFDKQTGSFFTTTAETGRRWENYMWNETEKGFFLTMTTHVGGSVSWLLRDTSEKVFLTDTGTPSCVYLRDDESGDYWNIAYAPTCRPVEDYCCEHGLAFSRFSSRRGGIFASQCVTVLSDELAEVWQVTLKNESDRPRNVSAFAFSQLNLNGFTQSRYYYAANTGATMWLKDTETLFCQLISPFMPDDIFSGYVMSSAPVAAFEGRLEHFFGTAGGYAVPRILQENRDLECTHAAVRARGGILQNKVTLAPGEETTVYYVFGFAPSDPSITAARKDALIAKAKAAFDGLYEKGVRDFGDLRTVCPEERINNLMNFWVQKQVSYCMLGKQAVRDNAQIVLGMLNYDTKLARKAVSDCLANQCSDGHSLLTWAIGWREPDTYSDPSTWLTMAVCEYIKESGDLAFCDEVIPYFDGGEATVYEHLQMAANWFMREDNYGPHGMPRIHHADWNDALNIPDDTAESVFMAMLICYSFGQLIELCRRRGDDTRADLLAEFREKLAAHTNEVAFNGDYYVRAFSKFGTVGDKTSQNGGNIYVNPQVWAILSDIIPADRLPAVLRAVDGMEMDCGVPICSPPYRKYDPAVGRMSAMPPGVYENGGIYNHACAFKVMADCKLGRGEQAVGTLLKMIPGGAANPSEKTTTEPYVFTNCYGKHENEDMVVGFSWQTGSSAWGLRDYYEGVLGITREFDGLSIRPNLPASWDTVTAQRPYRGSVLNIRIENRGGSTVKLTVDGKAIDANVIPAFGDNAAHDVLVELV